MPKRDHIDSDDDEPVSRRRSLSKSKRQKSAHTAMRSAFDDSSESSTGENGGKKDSSTSGSDDDEKRGKGKKGSNNKKKSDSDEEEEVEEVEREDSNVRTVQFDIEALYKKFAQNDEQNILGGSALTKKFESADDLSEIERSVFVYYAWRKFLNSLFLKENAPPTEEVENVMSDFVCDLMKNDKGDKFFDKTSIGTFIKKINVDKDWIHNGYKENWSGLPAILRLIAPKPSTLDAVNEEEGKKWMQSVLMGLPHSVIMAPLDVLKLKKKISGIEADRKKVSALKAQKLLINVISNLLLLLRLSITNT